MKLHIEQSTRQKLIGTQATSAVQDGRKSPKLTMDVTKVIIYEWLIRNALYISMQLTLLNMDHFPLMPSAIQLMEL
jgi:hypothetical protein